MAYQSFPSGDLVVKHNRWLEDALPGYTIKWTKFDSGADINTAFIAGELDFGAIGSSPVARGLSAPLNIPYQVAFVLDVAGDNEALVARNETGITDVAGPARQAGRHGVRLDGALQPARGAAAGRALDVGRPARRPAAAGVAGRVGAGRRRRGLHLAADAGRAAQERDAADREPRARRRPASRRSTSAWSPRRSPQEHPEAVDTWRKVETKALTLIHDDPGAAAAAIAPEIGATPEDAANQLKQGVYLTEQELTSPEWLGTDGAPGNVAQNLQSAAQFLAEQKQIPAAPDLATFQKAIYTKGLPNVLAS